jgi:hypothetical protein
LYRYSKEYVFAGSIDTLNGGGSSGGPDVELRGVVLPVVFSPWVLDASQAGGLSLPGVVTRLAYTGIILAVITWWCFDCTNNMRSEKCQPTVITWWCFDCKITRVKSAKNPTPGAATGAR